MRSTSANPVEQERLKALPWCLASGALVTIFVIWTFGGSVFVLFLSELGLPKGQIGAVLSLFPFCGLLALGFAPAAARWGWKRVFILCYGTRKLVMAALLLLPWVLGRYGHTVGLIFLVGIIVVFAVLRALAETAYYPWSQEFVPNRVRGTFTAWTAVLGMLVSCLALLGAGHLLGQDAGLNRYLILIGAGCLLGFLGVALMVKVPGGAPLRDSPHSGTHLANLLEALRDRNFGAYLGGLGGVTIGTTLLVCFLSLYLKEKLGLSPGTVVRLDAVAMVGGALSSLGWGWLADRVGSRPILMPALVLNLLIPAAWLLLPRHLPHAGAWCAGLFFVYGVASNGVAIGATRLLFNAVIPPEKSTAYTAIYYAWMGLTGGLAPLLAGGILSASAEWQTCVLQVPVDGYALLFIAALLCLVLGWWWYGRVRRDDVHTTRSLLRLLMNHCPRR